MLAFEWSLSIAYVSLLLYVYSPALNQFVLSFPGLRAICPRRPFTSIPIQTTYTLPFKWSSFKTRTVYYWSSIFNNTTNVIVYLYTKPICIHRPNFRTCESRDNKVIYQRADVKWNKLGELSVDEGNGRRESDNSWRLRALALRQSEWSDHIV